MNSAVPPAAKQNVVIEWVPLKTENSVLVSAQMATLQVLGLSFVEVSDQDSAKLSCEGVVAAGGANFASL